MVREFKYCKLLGMLPPFCKVPHPARITSTLAPGFSCGKAIAEIFLFDKSIGLDVRKSAISFRFSGLL